MANEREYLVVLKKGVNKAEFDAFMTSQYGNETIPARNVDVANLRPGSTRIIHYMLNDQEAADLKNNPSVIDVELPIEDNPDIEIVPLGSQTSLFYRGNVVSSNHVNWGLYRSKVLSQTTTAYNNTNQDYVYPLDGTGVDIVIQDSGIDPNHPEWNDADGNSRLAQINWATESGLAFTQSADHYRDRDGHGTHCAGIVAGKTYGWAKGAHIYSQKLLGLETLNGTDGTGISSTFAFDAIRLWHAAKTNGRPTVVNMSWGFISRAFGSPISGNYRGAAWTYTTQNDFALWQSYGIVPQFNIPDSDNYRRFPVRSAVADAEIEDMIDAGIHVCLASGNDYYKQDIPNGDDYNNTFTVYTDVNDTTSQTYNYHRGGSPYSDRAFNVGNINSDIVNNLDTTASSSQRGPAVNIWAPGTHITSTTSQERDSSYDTRGLVSDYPDDPTYKIMKIGGTSMASPQVAGFVACYLQMQPNATPEEVLNKVIDLSKEEINNTSDTDYTDGDALLGSPNRVLISPFQTQPVETKGTFTISNVGYEFDTTPDDAVPGGSGATYTINVTNAGAGSYTLSGDFTGTNATVTCNSGDTLLFNVNASGHPFYIKTSQVTGTGSQASGVTNNGLQTGQVSWTPSTPGTYYYICQFHSAMTGQIIVS